MQAEGIAGIVMFVVVPLGALTILLGVAYLLLTRQRAPAQASILMAMLAPLAAFGALTAVACVFAWMFLEALAQF